MNKHDHTSKLSIAQIAGVQPVQYISLNGNAAQRIDGAVIEEAQVCISVNGVELATFMCSPRDLEQMAVGFLANEGIISNLNDVRQIHVSRNQTCVDVWLRNTQFEKPRKFIITAGCGGGVTFDDLSQKYPPLTADLHVTPAELATLMRQVHLGAALYQTARGVHTAVLADKTNILIQMEDIGRHNCVDKLYGAALMQEIPTRGKILLTSGRISSEMLNKARRMEIPIICSRTSPTSLSVALAQTWNITIVAYLRQDRMRLYTHPERILTNTPQNSQHNIQATNEHYSASNQY
ncbi:MAG: formate dehydrogenase accessory sulfurtransferase FdhD [Chloroflexi bacterium]|nr:MAG: formate dehydrogenase accessory sulfurtransferase FdhD [Chloroflexota bacterium]